MLRYVTFKHLDRVCRRVKWRAQLMGNAADHYMHIAICRLLQGELVIGCDIDKQVQTRKCIAPSDRLYGVPVVLLYQLYLLLSHLVVINGVSSTIRENLVKFFLKDILRKLFFKGFVLVYCLSSCLH